MANPRKRSADAAFRNYRAAGSQSSSAPQSGDADIASAAHQLDRSVADLTSLFGSFTEAVQSATKILVKQNDENERGGGHNTPGGAPASYAPAYRPAGTFKSSIQGSSFAFGEDYNLLSANLRSGMIGEPTFRTTLGYASWGLGLPARHTYNNLLSRFERAQGRKLTPTEARGVEQQMMTGSVSAPAINAQGEIIKDENGNPQMENVDTGTAATWRKMSNFAGAASVASNFAVNAIGSAENISNIGSGGVGAVNPYLQYSMFKRQGLPGVLGDITSNVSVMRQEQNLMAHWYGLTTYNWSAGQEAEMRTSIMNAGINPQQIPGGLGGLRNLFSKTGLDAGLGTQQMENVLRYGSKSDVDQASASLKQLAQAAVTAGLGVSRMQQSLQQFSQDYSARTGASTALANSIGATLLQHNGVAPALQGGVLGSQLGQAFALTQGFHTDPQHPFLTAFGSDRGALASEEPMRQMIMHMMGLSNANQLKSAKGQDAYYKLKYAGVLDQFGMQGWQPSDFAKFMRAGGDSKDQFKKWAQGSMWNDSAKTAKLHATGEIKIDLEGAAKKLFKVNGGGHKAGWAKIGFESIGGVIGGSLGAIGGPAGIAAGGKYGYDLAGKLW